MHVFMHTVFVCVCVCDMRDRCDWRLNKTNTDIPRTRIAIRFRQVRGVPHHWHRKLRHRAFKIKAAESDKETRPFQTTVGGFVCDERRWCHPLFKVYFHYLFYIFMRSSEVIFTFCLCADIPSETGSFCLAPLWVYFERCDRRWSSCIFCILTAALCPARYRKLAWV